jgi:very-short-patch-repair endonuclease
MKEEDIREVCIDRLADHFDEEMDIFRTDANGVGYDKIESPIERMLYAALYTVVIENGGKFGSSIFLSPDDPAIFRRRPVKDLNFLGEINAGLFIEPQRKIGKYRVDFLIKYGAGAYSFEDGMRLVDKFKRVIVECDGHDWHETTEAERRSEKERDRFLQKSHVFTRKNGARYRVEGSKVLRFTGKEITDDPFKVAMEILDHVGLV